MPKLLPRKHEPISKNSANFGPRHGESTSTNFPLAERLRPRATGAHAPGIKSKNGNSDPAQMKTDWKSRFFSSFKFINFIELCKSDFCRRPSAGQNLHTRNKGAPPYQNFPGPGTGKIPPAAQRTARSAGNGVPLVSPKTGIKPLRRPHEGSPPASRSAASLSPQKLRSVYHKNDDLLFR